MPYNVQSELKTSLRALLNHYQTNHFVLVFTISPKMYFHRKHIMFKLALSAPDAFDANLKQWDYLMVSTCAAPYLSIVVDLSFVVKLDQYFCGGKLS